MAAFIGEDLDVDEFQKQLSIFEHNELIQAALTRDLDLRDYTKQIETDLREVEKDSIHDYMRESDNLTALHEDIRSCDDILAKLETMLSGFQESLGNISSEIKYLQEESMSMNMKLKNRRLAEHELSTFTERAVLPEDLLRGIEQHEVSESFLDYLVELNKKIAFTNEKGTRNTAAHALMEQSVSALKNKAVLKVTQFLKAKIDILKKPKTNFQILQQNVLIKFKYFNAFLQEHAPAAYQEVRDLYVSTMSKAYHNVFRVYFTDLTKLHYEVATKTDLLGSEEAPSRSLFASVKVATGSLQKGSPFALGDRANVLKEVNDDPIISHVALENGQKFAYEQIYRSMTKMLMDSVCTEYLFYSEFFGIREDLFEPIFGHTIQTFFYEKLEEYLQTCYDAIGILLMIRITYEHQLAMQRRRVPVLDMFHDRMNLILWPRFKVVFDNNAKSLTAAKGLVPSKDKQPHAITRRYADFTAATLILNAKYHDVTLQHNLTHLRMQMDKLLQRQAATFGKDPKSQAIYLINNFDLILQVLHEKNVSDSEDAKFFEEIMEAQSTIFVEEELNTYFGQLIFFVKEVEPQLAAKKEGAVTDLKRVETIVKEFAAKWKQAIDECNTNVLKSFSNLKTATELLKKVLTQLLLYYTRFLEILKKTCRNAPFMKDCVTTDLIMFEFKQKVKEINF
eukprot:TRINITY_DN19201_c0_g1::TRINITY_DN19201_c0_g1_i1::g.2358::m.2358 TRINITY_DN19201_c0_g1::TRINITY_DN19201_c0_g1_i1::g.2358  ORF type:complete len:679 (+),score=218.02,sp/Q94KD3/VP52A_ARATH/39.65/3e-169,Vps52/PF04129.7/3.4e-134,Sec3_C/PF09763.4/2.2e-06,Sec3_C/PF09763.4/0.0073,COG5/PF10392.4/0.0014,COG5/PF10392.4/7e+03,COG5/PF10392.4/15,COG2/PF06148.6/0.0039,COG2/PF06148.6/1.1e+04,COG2/PF06148.6/1.4e+03,Baculo_PEP_C/PF04513.7/4.3,Baculo_PEP_C/PF04513.7/8.2,DUF148/PF02520.12/4.7e+03,DUF148/PF02520.12/